MTELAKVQGHDGLGKDLRTSAIVNTDHEGLQRAREARARILQERQELEDMRNRLESLENALKQITERLSHG